MNTVHIIDIKDPLEKFHAKLPDLFSQFDNKVNDPNSSIPKISCYMAAIFYEYKRLDTLSKARAIFVDPMYKTEEAKVSRLLSFITKTFSSSQQQEIISSFSEKDQAMFRSNPSSIMQLIPQIKEIANPVLKEMDSFKESLTELYLSYNIPFFHISPVDIQDGHINPSIDLENQPQNEIVTGVFATSSYSHMNHYIARANVSGMLGKNAEITYPQNPFVPLCDQTNPSTIKLVKPVYTYALNPDGFEPQLHFEPLRKDGFAICFGDEWVKSTDVPIPFSSKETISVVDSEPFLKYNVKYIDIKNQRVVSFSKRFAKKFNIQLQGPEKEE